MKKLLSLLLVATMILSLGYVPVFAANDPTLTLSADKAAVKPNDIINYSVSISGDFTNARVLTCQVLYPTDVFDIVPSSAVGTTCPNVVSSTPDSTTVAGKVTYVNEFSQNGYTGGINGEIFKFSLKVKSNTKLGNIEVKLNESEKCTWADGSYNDNAFNLVNPTPTLNVTADITGTQAITELTAPEQGKVPDTAVELPPDAKYTADPVTWSPELTDGKFAPKTVYTASIKLTPNSYYNFANTASFTIDGKAPTTITDGAGGSKILTMTFPETALAKLATPKAPTVTTSDTKYGGIKVSVDNVPNADQYLFKVYDDEDKEVVTGTASDLTPYRYFEAKAGGITPGKSYTATATAISSNTSYTKSEESAKSTAAVADKVTPTAANFKLNLSPVTYNGENQTLTVTGDSGIGTITVKYAGAEGGKTAAGTYAITADVAGDTWFKAGSGITLGDWTIEPADYTYTVQETQDIKTGSKKDAIKVVPTNGVGINSAVVNGTFTWYTDSNRTNELTSDFSFVGVGTKKTLYWKFVASTDNYTKAPKTGSTVFNIIEGEPQEFAAGFTTAMSKTYGDAVYSDTATLTKGSGTITYSSSNTNVATVNATTGEVTIVGAGNTSITATAAAVPGSWAESKASYTLTVNPKTLTITGATATDRQYDGTNSVVVTGGTLDGIINSDDVTLDPSKASGTVADKKADTAKKDVTVKDYALSGAKAGNYTVNQPTGIKVIISKAAITVSGIKADNKQYDNTTDATLNFSGVTYDGKISGDALSVTAKGAFADAAVADNKNVTITELALDGADVGNYVLATVGQQTTATANITKKTVTVTDGDLFITKVYDGTTSAGTVSNGTKLGLTGVLTADNANVSVQIGTVGAYADKNAGNNKTISLSGLTLSGSAAGNYTLGSNTTFNFAKAEIITRPITVTVTPASREYGQANPTFAATADGPLGADDSIDDLGLGLTSAATKDSAPGKYAVTGDDTYNKNYTVMIKENTALTVTKATSTLTLKAKTTTYTATTADAPDCTTFPSNATVKFEYSKEESGTYTAGLPTNAGSYFVKGIIEETANYAAVTSAAVAFTISPASVVADWTHTNDLTYTGTAQKPTAKATGLGEDGDLPLTVSGEKTAVGTGYTATAAFTSAQPNYTLTNTTTLFNISKAQLSVTKASVTKVYDGLVTIANDKVSGVTISGDGSKFIQGTDYTVTGVFTDANANKNKAYKLKITLLGDAVNNYTVSDYDGSNGLVTPKDITISGAKVDNKVFDGNKAANCTSVSFDGMVAPESPVVGTDYTIDSAAFADENVGTAKKVTVTITWNNTNYKLATASYDAEANITSAPIVGVPVISIKTDNGTKGTVDAKDVLSVSVANMTPSTEASYSFQWKRGTENIGTDSSTYTIADNDTDSTITCVVTYKAADKNYDGSAVSSGIVVGKSVLVGTLALDKTGKQNVGTAIKATVTGGPDVANYDIVWLRDGVLIENATSPYTIKNADRGHTITAKAVSKGNTYSGEISTTDTVSVAAAAPGAPTVTAVAGVRQVELTWTANDDNGGNAIRRYKIYKDNDLVATLPNTSTKYTVIGLADSTEYTFKVSAVNDIGETKSDASKVKTASTPGQVTDLTATAGALSVSLNWNAPASDGSSPISGYKVYVQNGNGNFDAGKLIGNVTSYNATGLTAGTKYTFKVTAINSVGEGPESKTASATPTDQTGGGSIGGGSVTKPTTPEKIETTKPEVSDKEVSDAVKAAQNGKKNSVVVDASTLTETKIPATGLKETAEANLGLDISQKNGGISLSKDALTNIAKKADGQKPLEVSIKPVTSLPASDPAAASLPAGTQVFEMNVKVGTDEIHELGGKATVTLNVGSEFNGKTVAILHYENGKWNVVAQGVVKDGKFSVEVQSLSYFGVTTSVSPFSDVKTGDWYYDSVMYAYTNNIMKGISDTTFAPQGTTTRAMLVTMLYRMAGSPSAAAGGFTDVPSGTWYTDAVNWAAANKIVSGYGDGKFGPENVITREQMASILYNYAKYKGTASSSATQLTYPDKDKISSWAIDGAMFCQTKGFITGRDGGNFVPQGTATRAEVATVLMRIIENGK